MIAVSQSRPTARPLAAVHGPLTTGQVAKRLGLAPRTVAKLCDSGELPSYKLPGKSGERRIPQPGLVAFCRTHGMPLDEIESPVVLVVSADESLVASLRQQITTADVLDATDGMSAGMACQGRTPCVVVADWLVGQGAALSVVQAVRAKAPDARVYHICPDERTARGIYGHDDRAGVFFRPLSLLELGRCVASALSVFTA